MPICIPVGYQFILPFSELDGVDIAYFQIPEAGEQFPLLACANLLNNFSARRPQRIVLDNDCFVVKHSLSPFKWVYLPLYEA